MRRLINRLFKQRNTKKRRRDGRPHAIEMMEDRRMLCVMPPDITIDDVTLNETNNTQDFTVSLSMYCGQTVTVDYDTAEATGSDAAESGVDFTATSGTVSFTNGETSKTISVPILSDSLYEHNEKFHVDLSNASNGIIQDSQGEGTISDDDAQPTVSVADGNADEDAGTLGLTVTISAASGVDTKVDYATSNGTATAGSDYTSTSGTLTIAEGNTSGTINVTLTDDSTDEYDETLTVTLSNPVDATIDDGTATGTINDEDPLPNITIDDIRPDEGNAAVFTVTLSESSAKTVTVDYATANGTATTAGSDYTSKSGTLTFNPGDTSKTVSVTTNGDILKEANETFKVDLSNASNGTITDSQGVATLVDDDATAMTNGLDIVINGGVEVHSGGLRKSYTLPSGLSLLYNSLTNPTPIIAVETVQPDDGAIPDKIKAELTIGTVTSSPVYYDTTGLSGGDPQRFVMQVDASSLTSGKYDWTLKLTEEHGSEVSSRTFSGEYDVVNFNSSGYGANWTVDGLMSLVPDADGATVIYSNGTSARYILEGGAYQEPGWNQDSLVKNGDGSYTYSFKEGGTAEFNSSGQLTKKVDRNNNETSYQYFMSGNITTITDPYGRAHTFAYTDDELDTITDWDSRVTTFTVNASGQLADATAPDPDGAGPLAAPVTDYTYDATTGLMSSFDDALDRTTSYEYDHGERLKKRTFDDSSTMLVSPVLVQGLIDLAVEGTPGNPANLPVPDDAEGSITDGLSRVNKYETDRYGNTTEWTDAENNVTTNEFDSNGNMTKETRPDPDGAGPLGTQVTSYTYDADSNLTKITWPDNTTRNFEYDDDFHQLEKITDELGRITLLDINSTNGNLDKFTQVVGQIDDQQNQETDDVETTFTYTADPVSSGDFPGGLPKSLTDPLGRITEHTYETDDQQDDYGMVTSTKLAKGTADEITVSYEYDAALNLTAEVDGLSRRTEYTYDTLGRQTKIKQPDPDGAGPLTSPETEFVYDLVGNITKVTDPLDNDTTFTFDEFNEITKITYADPDGAGPLASPEIEFVFDAAGQLTKEIDALDNETVYSYTDRGLVDKVTFPDPDGAGSRLAAEVEYAYDLAGNVTSETDPLDNVTSFEYDIRDRLIKTTYADPDGAGPLASPVEELEYDDASQLTKFIDPLDRETAFTFDDLGRRTKITLPDLDGPGGDDPPEISFAYDDAGNLTAETDVLGHTTDFTYDNLDLLTKQTLPDPDDTGPLARPEVELEWDDALQLTKFINALDDETVLAYDNVGRVTSRTLPDPDDAGPLASPVYSFEYDAVGNVTKETDPLSNDTSYTYDAIYRLTKTTYADPDGAGPLASPEEEFEYDANGALTKSIDALDGETVFVIDNAGFTTSITLPDPDGGGPLTSPVISYEYDVAGNRTKVTDPLSNATDYSFDNLHRLTKVTRPDPDDAGPLSRPELEYVYDVASQVTKTIDALDRETSYTIDALGRVTKTTLPDPDGAGSGVSPEYEYAYDLLGNITTFTDARDHATDYTYDDLGRLTKVQFADPDDTGPLARPEVEFEYDAASRRTKSIDAMDRETVYDLDDLGRITKVTLPDPDGAGSETSPEWSFTYDAASNLTSRSDPLSETTDFTYDNLYRRTKIELPDPDGAGSLGRPNTDFEYDAVGNLTKLTDPESNETTWAYDALNRVTTETNELSKTRTFVYDAADNLTKVTDRRGWVRELSYDNLHQLTSEVWKDGATTKNTLSFAYDLASQMTDASDDNSDYDYTYDDLGQITQIDIDNIGPKIRFKQVFDAQGNRTELTAELDNGSGYVDDFKNTYTFDDINRLTKTEQDEVTGGNAVADKRVDFAYNAAGQFTTITRYDDVVGGSSNEVAVSTYAYDEMGRLTDLSHDHDTTSIADYDFTYDALSRVTQMDFTSSTGNDGISDYTYDATSQLTDADHDFQTDESYSFDENGNRTMTGYTTGSNNQLTSDGTFDYTYDDEGNRSTRTHIAPDPADDYTTEYTWDHHNRLTKLVYKDKDDVVTKEIDYTYDVLGQRIQKSVDADGAGAGTAVDTEYVYFGDHIALALDGDGDVTNRYLHGPVVDQILADEQVTTTSSPGEVLWPLTDNLGSVRDIIDSDGNVDNHITYDAFGNITSETAASVDHIFGYTGRERDEESDLYHNRARYYDPNVGRWTAEDPIGFAAADSNMSRYVLNSPTNLTDPSGLAPPSENDQGQARDGQANTTPSGTTPIADGEFQKKSREEQKKWAEKNSKSKKRPVWALQKPKGKVKSIVGANKIGWALWAVGFNKAQRDIAVSGRCQFLCKSRVNRKHMAKGPRINSQPMDQPGAVSFTDRFEAYLYAERHPNPTLVVAVQSPRPIRPNLLQRPSRPVTNYSSEIEWIQELRREILTSAYNFASLQWGQMGAINRRDLPSGMAVVTESQAIREQMLTGIRYEWYWEFMNYADDGRPPIIYHATDLPNFSTIFVVVPRPKRK